MSIKIYAQYFLPAPVSPENLLRNQGEPMSEDVRMSRRGLLVACLISTGSLLASRIAIAASSLRSCVTPTPGQVAGPFYPTHGRSDEDFDLTQVKGNAGKALGKVIYLRGQVLDDACRPIPNALVEIWQANTWGRYDHERDVGNPRPLDPNFQGWGRVLTDQEGFYAFKSIKPGPYPADNQGWIRPPHIHFRVARSGYQELITQMYFAGEALNDADHIRRSLPPAERERVTVLFGAGPPIADPTGLFGHFDILLRRAI
jgi:protocatechuate 3,4-dioxygenase, beta subunit